MRFLSLLTLSLPLLSAFDTGHHYDATRNGLEIRNFSRIADVIPIIQVCNFIPDWNSLALKVDMPNFTKYQEIASLLHFNNLVTGKLVRDYWTRFLTNQYDTVKSILNGTVQQKTETGGDTSYGLLDTNFMLICAMGYTLHATQDFYAHSNFINTLIPPTNDGELATVNSTCYYAGNTYKYDGKDEEWNLHTYYYPDKYKDDIKREFNDSELIVHGGYTSGINKDSYARQFWQQAYTSTFMATIDTIDTWRGWINNDTRWNELLNYNLSESERPNLAEGLIQAFRISDSVETPWDDSNEGHWKGPGSGSKVAAIDTATEFIRDDWQKRSVFQRGFYDTSIATSLTMHMGRPALYTPSDSLVYFPQPVNTTFDPVALGIVHNNPSDYKAIVLRTWAAGKWKTTPNHKDDQEVDGLYAIISIDGQEYREATQKSTSWTHPFWTAMRFVPANKTEVKITYNLMIYASDLSDTFENDQDVEAVIQPSKDINSRGAKQALETNYTHPVIRPLTAKKTMHTMKLSPISVEQKHAVYSMASSLRHKMGLTSQKMSTLASSEIIDGVHRDEINPDTLDRLNKGVVFTYNTVTQQITSGLPAYYLAKTYLDIDHTLRLQGMENVVNIAQVNVSIVTHSMCEQMNRQRAGIGEASAALVAAPEYDGWGGRNAATQQSVSIMGGAVLISLSLLALW